MRKLVRLATHVFNTFALLALAGTVYAANVNIGLTTPKSPTNQNSFGVGFVTLDVLNRPVSVKCFKKGPLDGGFVQFGSTINLIAGGNSGNCELTSAQFNGDGNYDLKVEATAGSDTAIDQVSFTYDTSGPGDPRDYNKTKPGSCTYNIHFKTAPDSGATVKVEVYRSENTSFNTDGGTRVGTVMAGSDELHDFPDTVPNCDRTYYYATRAFDSAGNGSGVVGDSVTVTTTVVSPTVTQQTGAIPVSGIGNVLGTATSEGEASGGQTLGAETSPSPTPETGTVETAGTKTSLPRNLTIGAAILLLGALLYAFRRRSQDNEA